MRPSSRDHLGLDSRARVMVRVEGGKWKLQQASDAR
jgi:hypothetical protein